MLLSDYVLYKFRVICLLLGPTYDYNLLGAVDCTCGSRGVTHAVVLRNELRSFYVNFCRLTLYFPVTMIRIRKSGFIDFVKQSAA